VFVKTFRNFFLFTIVDCALGIEEAEIFGRQIVMHDNTPRTQLFFWLHL
jgi:hypothetical protein